MRLALELLCVAIPALALIHRLARRPEAAPLDIPPHDEAKIDAARAYLALHGLEPRGWTDFSPLTPPPSIARARAADEAIEARKTGRRRVAERAIEKYLARRNAAGSEAVQ